MALEMENLFVRMDDESFSRLSTYVTREYGIKLPVNKRSMLESSGHAYIAPGGRHMELYSSGAQYFIKVRDGQLVNRHKPSVDVLFDSVARHAGQNAMGIIMTGMGHDGASGLLSMKNAGAHTVAQDEASSIVYAMPREAVAINAANQILSLTDMPSKLISYF